MGEIRQRSGPAEGSYAILSIIILRLEKTIFSKKDLGLHGVPGECHVVYDVINMAAGGVEGGRSSVVVVVYLTL